MTIKKVKDAFLEKRLPWFIKARLEWLRNCWCYWKNAAQNVNRKPGHMARKIGFICGFHGQTGGVCAIANIANLLSRDYWVGFASYPGSHYNRLLDRWVRIGHNPDFDADIFICDVSCDLRLLEKIKALNKKLIVSCHGMRHSGHGLTSGRVMASLRLADKVHFVSDAQQKSFGLDSRRYTIIPNTIRKINKKRETVNVGIVGNLNSKNKNVDESVAIAMASMAEEIHLWYIDGNRWQDPRIRIHQWESNKDKIYNSFDVLVFMSRSETFGMVIIEAMSAGIPCILSDIPAFHQFLACPGVCIVNEANRENAGNLVNRMLREKSRLKLPMIRHWERLYAENAIQEKWNAFLSDI